MLTPTNHNYQIVPGMTPERRARELTSRILGVPEVADAAALISAVDHGFESAAVTRLAEHLGAPETDLLDVIDIARSTFGRRKKQHQRLTRDESDRLYRVTRLVARAAAVLGGDDEARRWMQTPKRALGGVPPLVMSRTDAGAREVEDLLGRIEYGIPS